jgi:hypothetical protein
MSRREEKRREKRRVRAFSTEERKVGANSLVHFVANDELKKDYTR